MIKAIHHANITVPRIAEAEARAFYLEFLELQEKPKPQDRRGKGGFWIDLGACELHVALEDGDFERGKTNAHIAYVVDNLGSWRRKLNGAGIETRDMPALPSAELMQFRDPFGNKVEFVQLY